MVGSSVLLLDHARAYRFDAVTRRFVRHRNLLIDGETIVGLDVDPSGLGALRRDLDGATVVPAFTDCHVHLAKAGYDVGARSFSGVRSYAEFESAIAALPPDGEMLYAGRYDDARWHDGRAADTAPLERHHAHRRAMIVRVDGHSCLVNRRTLDWLDLDREIAGLERDPEGVPTGRLFLDANWTAQYRFIDAIPLDVQRASERRAAELARARGIAHVHVQLLGRDRAGYAADVAFLQTLPVRVHPKICEPDAGIAHELGLPYVGGDVFLDGSIGSCTAALSQPYEGQRGRGALRFSDAAVEAYVAGAEALGMSAGVHAIGDAAIAQFVDAVRRVLGDRPSARGTHHFIEHCEMPADDHVEAIARLGLHVSVQPQFQATWGQRDGMYDQRVGRTRRARMNPLRGMMQAGAVLCGGSDAPVCELDALAGMHAACTLQEPEACLDPHEALALYTVNAAAFGRVEAETGNLAPGLRADLALLDGDPLDGVPFDACTVMETFVAGPMAR